jgi:hypothetical protein
MLQNGHIDFFNDRPILFALSFYGFPFWVAAKFSPLTLHLLHGFPCQHVPKMSRTVRLDPKIVQLESQSVEYFKSMVFEPIKDSFPSTGKNEVMTKFINHSGILQEVLRPRTG